MTDTIAPIATQTIPSSVLIEDVRPQIDGGRYPVKREVGDTLEVSADIFKDGHDALGRPGPLPAAGTRTTGTRSRWPTSTTTAGRGRSR